MIHKRVLPKLLLSIIIILLFMSFIGCSHDEESTTNAITSNISENSQIAVTTNKIFEFEELSTLHTTTLYDGSVIENTVVDTPADGNKYVILSLIVKIDDETLAFNKSNLYIQTEDDIYYPISEDILTDHNYTDLGIDDIFTEEFLGNVIFEIPASLTSYEIFYNADETIINVVYDESAKLTILDPYNVINVDESNIEVSESILVIQSQIEEAIYTTYEQGDYSLENPYVVQDPYGTAPLTALAVFDTPEASEITVTVIGKDEYTDVVNTVDGYTTYHEIPILGLYGGADNTVRITAISEDGTETSHELTIITEELPDYLLTVTVDVQNSEEMQDGFTMLHSHNMQMFDDNGDTRWYSSQTMLKNAFTVLEDGKLIYGFEEFDDTYLYLADMLGKIYAIYFIPNGVHHDIYELENGNLLITGNSEDGITGEDRIIELDINTGDIVVDIDLKEVFDSSRVVSQRWSEADWLHLNTIRYDENDNSIIISGRNQDMVAKLSYPDCEIQWIFADDYNWSSQYEEYLVTPIGEDFEWFWEQHTPEILPDLDNNEDTIDILLFDNGAYKSFDSKTATPDSESYSRAVHYRINEVTLEVEQLWQYGKERGTEFYSSIKGDVDYYEETHSVIITSPAICDNEEIDTAENVIITEVDMSTNEVIYEVHIDNGWDDIYRSERMELYPSNWNYSLLDSSSAILFGTYRNESLIQSEMITNTGSMTCTIDGISIQSSNLSISGSYTIDTSLSQGQASIVFLGEESSYQYDIYTEIDYSYDTTVDRILNKMLRVTSNYIGIIDTTFLFDQLAVPLDTLSPDTYIVGLMVKDGDTYQVVSTDYYFTVESDTSVVEDIDILVQQAEIDSELLTAYAQNDFTLNSPYVVVNPYGSSPLSALVMFETDQEANIQVTIVGKDEYSTIQHTYEDKNTSHQIPIYGLYEQEDTTVFITAYYDDGTQDTTELTLQGEVITAYVPEISIETADISSMQDGLTFVMPPYGNICVYAFDCNGDIRYINENAMQGCVTRVTEDGRILMSSEDLQDSGYYAESFYEIDFLGKIYVEYISSGLHHDLRELPNGNYLYLGENYERGTVEDIIMEMDVTTGAIIDTWDLAEILTLNDYIATETYEIVHFGENEEDARHDWLHINSIWYDEATNSITLSSRHQDLIMNIDYSTKEINWILTDPNNPLLSDSMSKYILDSIGENFEYTYGNHAAMITEEGNLFVFDNGTYRSKTVDDIVQAEENYSRAVEYVIDAETMTVEQIWEYGKDEGSTNFALYVSDVDILDNDNRFLTFGGIIRDENGNASNSMSYLATGGSSWTILVELCDDVEVFKAEITSNSYRAERMPIYTQSTTNVIVGNDSIRLGEETFSIPTTNMVINEGSSVNSILESANYNGYRLRINGISTCNGITDVYIEIQDELYLGEIADNIFSFDLGIDELEESCEIKIYFVTENSEWLWDEAVLIY